MIKRNAKIKLLNGRVEVEYRLSLYGDIPSYLSVKVKGHKLIMDNSRRYKYNDMLSGMMVMVKSMILTGRINIEDVDDLADLEVVCEDALTFIDFYNEN